MIEVIGYIDGEWRYNVFWFMIIRSVVLEVMLYVFLFGLFLCVNINK